MSGASLYTPWVETGAALRERNVGREEELALIRDGARRLIQGDRTLPLYFFGPRGTGKSHVLALAVAELQLSALCSRVPVHTIPEDIPQVGSAEDLWRRICRPPGHARWLDWGSPQQSPKIGTAMVIIEGFDRHTRALGIAGCRELRGMLREHPGVWLVCTGARLPDELTDKDAAFYGYFDTRPITPFDEPEAGELLDRQVSDEVRSLERWNARKAAALTLAGGNPRALIALANAFSAAPKEEIAKRLLQVLDEFTAHFQLRFQDLSANEQQLVELLSIAPRALGPTEVAGRLGGVSSTWSTVAGRLQDLGVVRSQQEGRNAWYRIAEPLFRYWLEYRGAPWRETRVAWLGRLLEMALGPAELVETWTDSADPEVRSAALGAVQKKAETRAIAWSDRCGAIEDALQSGARLPVPALVREAASVVPDAAAAWSLVWRLNQGGALQAAAPLSGALSANQCPTLGQLLKGLHAQVEARPLLSALLTTGLAELARVNPKGDAGTRARSLHLLVALLDAAIRTKNTQGAPWRLKPVERAALLGMPFLRGRFYSHGRLPAHEPMLTQADLLAASISPADTDLPELFSMAVRRRHNALAHRLLATLDSAPRLGLPWCPWPGRRLQLDALALARVMSRTAPAVGVTWLGALSEATDDAMAHVFAHLGAVSSTPFKGLEMTYQLSLTGLALRRPDRRDRARDALGAPWREIFERVDLLERQLQERERGPLHPELARIYQALGEIGGSAAAPG